MKGINVAKDLNTVYLSVTCENKEEQDKVIDLIKACLFGNLKVETLDGALSVDRAVPKPMSSATKVEVPSEVPVTEKKEKYSTMPKPVEDVKTADTETEDPLSWHKQDTCPICGGTLSAVNDGKFCNKCGLKTKIYGIPIDNEMVKDLINNGKTKIIQFNSPNYKSKGYFQMTEKGKIQIKKSGN